MTKHSEYYQLKKWGQKSWFINMVKLISDAGPNES